MSPVIKTVALILCAVLLAHCDAADPAFPALTAEGLGKGVLGMTTQELREAGLAPFKVLNVETERGCSYVHGTGSAGSPGSDVYYMLIDRRLVRIDVRKAAAGNPPTLTAEGVGVGALEEDVLKIYGKNTTIEPHKYDENGHVLVVHSNDPARGLIFETSQGKVTSFRAGLYPALGFVEGCS